MLVDQIHIKPNVFEAWMTRTYIIRNCFCSSPQQPVDVSKDHFLNPLVCLLWCVHPLCRACPTSTPVTSKCMAASSPPTVWWTIAWWWRSQTLAATPSLAPAEVKPQSSLIKCLSIPSLSPLSDIFLPPPLRPVDRSRASEEGGHLSEGRRVQLCHHLSGDRSQKEHLLHRVLLRPSRCNTPTQPLCINEATTLTARGNEKNGENYCYLSDSLSDNC